MKKTRAPGRILLIVNPVAGKGKALETRPQMEEYLLSEKIPYEVLYTERSGHASLLAEEAALEGYRTIVAVGGDGTYSEVCHGILSSGKTGLKVAVVPAGTGNDFVGGSGFFENGFEDAIKALSNGQDKKVDAVRLEDSEGKVRYGVNSVGFGFDAYVVKRTQELGAKRFGHLGYMYEALRGLFAFEPLEAKAKVEGKERLITDLWLFALTNSERFGGGMRVAPNARVDDGFLECSILSGVSRFNLLQLMMLVRQGRHLGKKGVAQMNVKSVTLDIIGEAPAHIDGDVIDVTYPVTVQVMPAALTLRVPSYVGRITAEKSSA